MGRPPVGFKEEVFPRLEVGMSRALLTLKKAISSALSPHSSMAIAGDTHGQSPDGPATTPNGLNKMVQGTPATATSPSNTGVTARSNLDIGQTKGVSGCEDLLYDAQHYGGGGSVNIDLQIIALCANKPDQKIVFHPGEPLYFRAVWEHKSATGLSYSRAFTTVGEDEQIIEHARGQSIYSALSPFKPASYSPNTQDGTSPSGGTQSPGVDEALNPSSTNGSGSSTSRTGLELGAIIGIAVGCGLAGLLAVLGIIWFIVRRRQQKQDLLPVGSFNSDNRGDDLMAEKEARTGVDVDASPNSPYSDDGHANGAYPPGTAVITTAAAAIPPHQDQSRSYTPYSDRPGAAAGATPSIRTDSIAQNDEGARANVPSPIPGRATPRGLTTPYAHLVEEGMTEEEIRRLEEEERQLDAAIEQAGRR
ncbi:hypothetical protein B0T21DRAFT_169582 [Apiosordaria backusii]|uniref:Uncharacterized protein n=1 Tax=Apiosordaria backusii TaxID=314023 RepID=A0AA40BNU9_9PEZI|nr:hypothetical protein B0T21DRAFT_169582 [Apiosordaria backusii]